MFYLKNLIPALTVLSLFSTGCFLKKNETKIETDEKFSERDEMEKAMQQEFLMTADPALGYIPKERLIAALDYKRKLMAARGAGINAFTWTERGPSNIAGRTRAVFIDSRDATGNTVFAASVSGGIWKATNFKAAANPTWTQVNPSMGSLAVSAMAQDPSNGNIIYAGTGEGWFNSDAVRGNGIWKSADGGSTWNKLTSTDSTVTNANGQTLHNFDFIQDIVVNSSGVVFASSRPNKFCNTGGIFRSTNGGANWTRVIGSLQPGATTCAGAYNFYGADLEIASNGDLFATTGYNNNGTSDTANYGRIWYSSATINGDNTGAANTWTDITPPGEPWQRIEIAPSNTNPSVVYALLEGTGNAIGAIKKTTNSGATWTDLPIPTWCNQGSNSSDFTNGQAFYNLIVQVNPTNENTVIIGGIDLFKSTNGGTSWTQITQWARNCTSSPGGSQLPTVHADQHNIIFYPGSATELIATNDGGIYYSSAGGTSWATTTTPNLNGGNQTTISEKNIGYNTIQLYATDVHPSKADYFLIGSQDNGSLQLTSAALGVAVEASIGGDGGYSHIDQTDGNLQVISYVYNNYYYSRDGGNRFTRISFNENGMFINPSDLDDRKKVLYSGSGPNQLGLISNLAGTGSPTFSANALPALGSRKISAVKADPTVSGGGTVWVAGFDSIRKDGYTPLNPVIIKVTNANTSTPVASATTVLNSSTVSLNGAYISSIDVDPADAKHLLVTLSNYGIPSVFESTDAGNSFINIEGNLPDIPVRWGMFLPASAIVDGTNGGGILLATEIGVWFTQTSSGSSTVWLPQNSGLPNVRCDMLRYRPSDGLLAVATHGRGLFTASLTLLPTVVPPGSNPNTFIDYISATQQQLFVKVGNLNITSMEIRLFAADGKLVYSSKTNYADQNITIAHLARGSYILKIYGNNNERYTKQFIK